MTDRAAIEWRELGFFPGIDDTKRAWILTGSRTGLLRLRDLLLDYVADTRNTVEGEHDHYGPYGSLKVMTWHTAGFDGNSIHGSLGDLARLARLIEEKLRTAMPNSLIEIREEFASGSPYSLILNVQSNDFDPASADPDLIGRTT